MKKNTFLFLVSAFVFTSCSKLSFDIAKRKYRTGFYVDISNNNKKPAAKDRHTAAVKRNERKPVQTSPASFTPSSTPESVAILPQNNGGKTESPGTVLTKQQHPKENHTSPLRKSKADAPSIAAADKAGQKRSHNADKMFFLFSAASGLLAAAILRLGKNRMRKASYWARDNKQKSRFALSIAHVALAAAAIFAGKHLHDNNYLISPAARNTMAVLFTSAAFLYPKKSSRTYSYMRHKATDAALVLSGAMLVASASNHLHADRSSRIAQMITSTTEWISPAPSMEASAYNSFSFSEQNHPVKSTGAKIALLILALAVFVVLAALVAGLSCNLSCSGNEGAAVLVLIFGLGGLITLLVITIKAIFKK